VAYCAEFHKDNPSPESEFAIESPEPTLACNLTKAQRHNLSLQATQAAVWIATDGVKLQDLRIKFHVSDEDWEAASLVASSCGSPEEEAPFQSKSSAGQSAPEAVWTEHYRLPRGTLSVSPDRVRYEQRDKQNRLTKDSFSASCSQIAEWKTNKENALNYVFLCADCPWSFHIRLKNGKSHFFTAPSKADAETILNMISKACGLN